MQNDRTKNYQTKQSQIETDTDCNGVKASTNVETKPNLPTHLSNKNPANYETGITAVTIADKISRKTENNFRKHSKTRVYHLAIEKEMLSKKVVKIPFIGGIKE